MRKEYLEVGQIVSTHGLHGEVRVQPWCDSPAFMTQFAVFYFDGSGERAVKAENVRPHGNIAIVKLAGTDSVEQAQSLRGKVLYIRREDAQLPPGDYFIQELFGCSVIDADTGVRYGELTDVSQTGANDVWHVSAGGKEYLMPAVKEMVERVDVETGVILVRPVRGIFDGAFYED